MQPITVNGREYAWGNVNVVLPGRTVPVDGVTEISYEEKNDQKVVHGRGFKPRSIQPGKLEYTGSVSILQSEFEGFVKGIGGSPSSIRDAVITVSYGDAATTPIIT